MAFGPRAPPKLWRSTRKESTPSIASASSNADEYTFGMQAPIVDFFGHDYITKFAPLEDILNGKADKIMEEAYKKDPTEESYLPRTTSGPNFRWYHIPANNMIWVEEIIKRVCESKAEKRTANAKGDKQKKKRKALKAGDILSDKYWIDQQRGCIKHCANHPLYARHMVPYFAEIPTNWESATASIVAPVPDPTLDQQLLTSGTPVTLKSRFNLDTGTTHVETVTDHNMVLFMPYLHWASSGPDLDHWNTVIKELADKFRNPFYRRPTPAMIELEETNLNMKILRAYLHPKNDRCLHVRRTLDQYYYSTLTDADERTVDQVVYKFAMKQHRRKMEEAEKAVQEEKKWGREQRERRMYERLESSSRSSRSGVVFDEEPEEMQQAEASWNPPKVMMVNQLWLWIIDGDTVITSFPSKSKSDLSMDDRANEKDIMEGDDFYDSTDIWRAVQRELRHKTTYGQRTAKSALDLAWTIADQARGVFQKRNLHPHLQFMQMFEMEINEITFRQAEVFNSFSRNVKAAHNANNIGKLLGLLSTFRRENFATTRTQTWKDNFRVFAIDFKITFNKTVAEAQSQAKAQGKHWPAHSDAWTSNFPDLTQQPSRDDSIAGSKPHGADTVEYENWSTVLKTTYTQLQETIENARIIKLTHEDIEAQLLDCLISRFNDLEIIVPKARSTTSLSKMMNSLVAAAFKSLDWYTDLATETLFDFTKEANLMTEIKDILDELNIISCIRRQQEAVIRPFMYDMLNQPLDTQDKSFYDSGRMESEIEELQKTARSTHAALQHQLDLKQKQISVIEARAARKDAKSSAAQAEISLSLTTETVKQGWSIMIFTVVTIIFLPLSFFTGLFGMNARELLSAQYSIGYFSMIMYPVSFVITCISLGLALQPEFRTLVRLAPQKISSFKWWLLLFPRLWEKLTMEKFRRRFQNQKTTMGILEESIELERETSQVWSKV